MFITGLLLTLSYATAFNVKLSPNPDTVDSLDVSKYLGLWYQMAADQIVYSTFEKDSYCDTALYGDNGDGTISVHNYATIGSPNGTVYTIDGYAYQKDPENEPGQLTVTFDSDDAAPFPAPYWILELGPVNKDGLYDYAIVSDNLSLFLFVLARDVDTFNSIYKDDVATTLESLGFTGYTAPIYTYHEDDCVYESAARMKNMKPSKTTVSGASSIDTVDELKVESYMGYWYQVLGDKFVTSTTIKNSYCNTALYTLQEDGSFTVHNSGNSDSPSGAQNTIDGYAFIPDSSEPGKLTLHFDSVPTDGSYWVLAVGPEVDGKYDWSIVSDPTGLSLYVLARDYTVFKDKYETEVLKMLDDMGFDGYLTTPIELYQGSECAYEPLK